MIFIDTDIFVIDKLFPNDERYEINKALGEEGLNSFEALYIYMVEY